MRGTMQATTETRQSLRQLDQTTPFTPIAAFMGWLRSCWQRERMRRELATMLADRTLAILSPPASLVADAENAPLALARSDPAMG